MMRFFYLLMLAAVISNCDHPREPISQDRTNAPETLEKPYVIMISIDGFRFDYAEKYGAEHILEIAQNGISTETMMPSYPSKTFPNHYTLVTGMSPARHGIVNNSFYDPTRKEHYRTRGDAVKDGTWYGGTPLWVLAEQQGMLSASYFWVGSEADIQGMYPTYYYAYDGSVPNQDRVDQVIDWLKLPEEKRPHMLFLYFSMVDSDGHNYGPESEELIASVQVADELIGNLRQQLKSIDLPVNTVLVSDHGMLRVDNENPIYPNDLADLSDFELTAGSSFLMAYHPDSARVQAAYQELKANEDRYTVYLRDSIPEYLDFRDNQRIGDILLMAKAPNIIAMNKSYTPDPGTHGYDVESVSAMGAIFYASGPAFKKGLKLPPFRNVHVYPLVAKILGLEIGEIDGDIAVLEEALVE